MAGGGRTAAWSGRRRADSGLEGLAEIGRRPGRGRKRQTTASKWRTRSNGALDEPDGGLEGQTVAGDSLERPDRPGNRLDGLDGGRRWSEGLNGGGRWPNGLNSGGGWL